MFRSKKAEAEISRPVFGSVTHNVHVSKDFVWSMGENQTPDTSFVLGDMLGEGAQGQVFKATHVDTGFVLAIKIIRVGILNEKKKKEIDMEIDILNRCRHPNIVSYYGCFHHRDCFWILMDFCGQGSVRQIIEKKLAENNNQYALKEPQICEFLFLTVKGLVYLHSKDIVHRDIKSGNILLSDNGDVKLADFSVSAAFRNKEGVLLKSQTTTKIGTQQFMAPEVVASNAYDNKADIWSLGITAIELAEGNPPHSDKNAARILYLITYGESPKLKDEGMWSSEFKDFIAVCLRKDPNTRPTAEQLFLHPFMKLRHIFQLTHPNSVVAHRAPATPPPAAPQVTQAAPKTKRSLSINRLSRAFVSKEELHNALNESSLSPKGPKSFLNPSDSSDPGGLNRSPSALRLNGEDGGDNSSRRPYMLLNDKEKVERFAQLSPQQRAQFNDIMVMNSELEKTTKKLKEKIRLLSDNYSKAQSEVSKLELEKFKLDDEGNKLEESISSQRDVNKKVVESVKKLFESDSKLSENLIEELHKVLKKNQFEEAKIEIERHEAETEAKAKEAERIASNPVNSNFVANPQVNRVMIQEGIKPRSGSSPQMNSKLDNITQSNSATIASTPSTPSTPKIGTRNSTNTPLPSLISSSSTPPSVSTSTSILSILSPRTSSSAKDRSKRRTLGPLSFKIERIFFT
eukprot:TRINITY_DN2863_c0_g5_i2.p1 TRINITY_DN2863_c0_g5~~TRINITY_DN2863_c0_g5_i2.p1  ORF type:complete len:686 (+),score=185.93 TRINITY_DN2863_c0_g5_i2:151-2208(+)